MKLALWLLLLASCGGAIAPATSDGSLDAAVDAPTKSAACASSFDVSLTQGFGKLDGTVVAVVTPSDTQCAFADPSHVIVEVRMQGNVYRVAVELEADHGADRTLRFAEIAHPGFSPWLEAWHSPGAAMDYPSFLDVHSGPLFTSTPPAALAGKIADAIPVGAQVSIYATGLDGTSATLVRRIGGMRDGAIVVNASGPSTTWLLFHSADQTF